MKKYRIDFQQIQSTKEIISNGCNAISFTNRGTDTATINNEPLPAGETMSINGLEGEQDFTKYQIKWATGATSKLVCVKMKIYDK